MVSQKLVQEVMEILDKPCSPKDIADYMKENNLSNIASDIKWDISSVLNIMRKWYVVDKLPDLHGIDSNKWYLVKDGNPHDSKNCKHCKGITKAHNKNMAQYMQRQSARKVKLVEDEDDVVFKDEDGLIYTWK